MNTTSLPITLNRGTDAAFALPADGWVQLAPYGEVAAPMRLPGGEEVTITQVLNRETAEVIAAKFRATAAQPNFPGMLVDFDHFSHDEDKGTRAAGWIEEVEARDDGLWGRVKFSASGKTALEGGDYRLFSPVLGFAPRDYKEGERVAPVVLLRGALTNDPRFKGMLPVSNRDQSLSASENQTTHNATTMDYKAKLLAILGLAATATDAEIESALTPATENMAAGKQLPEVKNRVTALEKQLVEHDLDKAGLQGEARTAATTLLTKNRDEGLAFIAALGKQGSGYTPVHNREGKRAPAADQGKPSKADQAEGEIRSYRTANRCTYEHAEDAVRRAKPELFTV
jgi:phage I-like protein